MRSLVHDWPSGNRLDTRCFPSGLPPFSCVLKATISFFEDMCLPSIESIERRDVSNGTVQPHGVVLGDLTSYELSRIIERRRGARSNAIAFDRAVKSLDFSVGQYRQ